jgi:hypothetical protein
VAALVAQEACGNSRQPNIHKAHTSAVDHSGAEGMLIHSWQSLLMLHKK